MFPEVNLPFEKNIRGKSIYYGQTFKPGYDVVIARNDILNFLESLPPKSAKLVLTSPHYNMGKTHEQPLDLARYLKWQKTVITKCITALQDDGSICWQSGNYVDNGETFPLDVFFYGIFKKFGLKLRNRIIWHFEHGLHSRKKLSGRYETILWFTKGDNFIFNLDDIRVPQKYPGKRAYKGPNKGRPTCNPIGKNPSDFWRMVESDWEKGVWDIPNVKANHPEKTIHPSQFPIS